MRAHLALALMIGCAADSPRTAHPPIDTINAILGDVSFVAARGRLPNGADDFAERIAIHLEFVESLLRGSATPGSARAVALDHLRDYRVAGRFPRGESALGLLPTWVDRDGTRCAVAHVMEHTLGGAAVMAVDARHHSDFVADMAGAELDALVERSGLTPSELAMIQPAYLPQLDFHVRVGGEYSRPIDAALETTAALTASLRMIRRHNRWVGAPQASLDGKLGGAANGPVYAAHLRVGSGFTSGRGLRWLSHISATIGVGVEAMGATLPRAATVPIDVAWYIAPSDRTRLGAIAGPKWVLGDDRRAWHAALDFVLRSRDDRSATHITVSAQEIAGATYVGVGVQLASLSRLTASNW